MTEEKKRYAHGTMVYQCKDCGEVFTMKLETGIEEKKEGGQFVEGCKPSPFIIRCPFCGGAAKDRHENIGFGKIGFDALNYIVHHPDFEDVPKILETPYIPSTVNPKRSYAPYEYEIEMLRKGKFDPHMKEKIIKNNEKPA